jgi:hypothetical protein
VSVTVLAPAFYDNHEWATRYLRQSAERHGVPITWYGVGEPYRGWHDVQLVRLLAELRKVDTSHVLYTDSSDAMFLTSLDEIERTYVRELGNPALLISVEHDGGVNAGGWMGQTQWAIDALDWLNNWTFDGDDYNPQNRWREALVSGELFGAEKDLSRAVFQVADETLFWGVPGMPGRVQTIHSRSYPAVLHWAGGYTDPKIGKAALIEPVWRELGYEGTVEL